METLPAISIYNLGPSSYTRIKQSSMFKAQSLNPIEKMILGLDEEIQSKFG